MIVVRWGTPGNGEVFDPTVVALFDDEARKELHTFNELQAETILSYDQIISVEFKKERPK